MSLSTYEYDDGNAAVPGGIIGPVERVIVIGAGISGLSVASALTNAGVDCVVWEARDRIGGRLHTINLGATPVDLGGSWIHHPIGNPLRRFVSEQGLTAPGGDPLPTIGGFDAVESRRLSPDEVDQHMELVVDGFGNALDRLRAELPEVASGADGIGRFVETSGLTAQQARWALQGLRGVLEADAADRAENQSLKWLWNEVEYDGDLFGDLPTGGYRSVVEAMAAGLDIRRGLVVDSVEVGAEGVQVRATDGTVDAATHVVVTVPLGVLRSNSLTFTPDLPAAKQHAVDTLGFGHYEKVVVQFERAFWRDAGLSHLIYFPTSTDQPTTWIFDLDAFGAGPALAAHIFHSATPQVLERPQHEAITWVRGMVSGALGAPCPEPTDAVVTSWAHDPFARGAYAHVPPGATPAMLDLLGDPAHGRILFAGEHTQSARTGYADGAMTSGIREAKRLLGQPSVRLGRLASG